MMKPLNEHTIKRLQKLAGISEIRVGKPGRYSLKDIIEPVKGIAPMDNNHPYRLAYHELFNNYGMPPREDEDGNPIEPNKDENEKIIDLKNYKRVMTDPVYFKAQTKENLDWLEKATDLRPNQMYILNTKYQSYKFTTDSEGVIHRFSPSREDEEGNLLMRYDESGKLIPNN